MDPTKVQALTDALRRRETFATIGQLSGDPVLGAFGQQEMRNVAGRRKGLREALESARKRQDCKPSGMPGQMICGGQIQEVPGYHARVAAEKEKDRQARIEAAQVGREGTFANQLALWQARKQYMQPSEWGPISKSLAQIEALGRTIPEVALSEDIAQPTQDWLAGVAKGAGLGGPARMVEPFYRSDSARATRTKIKKQINAIRHSEFGAALTAMEKPEFAEVDPLAEGLSKEDMLQRLEDLVGAVITEARIRIGDRVGPGGEQMPAWLAPGYSWMPAGGQGAAPQMRPKQVPVVPEEGPGQMITPKQLTPGPSAPQQRTPRTMPKRPDGITDEEWQRFLYLEGLGGV